MTASCIYEGTLRHRRLEPVTHGLRYRIVLMYLDLGELPELFDAHLGWSARRPALAWFRRRDYLGDPDVALDVAVRDLVESRTGIRPSGPVRLLTHLRVGGWCFNPVSIYYCFDADGERVEAVVAEVTNTPWGERHAYVVPRDGSRGSPLTASIDKAFHVSPFMPMDQRYRLHVPDPGDRLLISIESEEDGVKIFDATLSLRRSVLDRRRLLRLLLRFQAASPVTLGRIYGHALALRVKGAPYHRHP